MRLPSEEERLASKVYIVRTDPPPQKTRAALKRHAQFAAACKAGGTTYPPFGYRIILKPPLRYLLDRAGLSDKERHALIAYYWANAPHCADQMQAAFWLAGMATKINDDAWRQRREDDHRGMTPKELCYKLGRLSKRGRISDATLNTYAIAAKVPTPKRGERDHVYTNDDTKAICRYIVANLSINGNTRQAAKDLLATL